MFREKAMNLDPKGVRSIQACIGYFCVTVTKNTCRYKLEEERFILAHGF